MDEEELSLGGLYDQIDPDETDDQIFAPYALSDDLAAAAVVRRNNATRETRSGNWQMSSTTPGTYVEGIAAIEESMWIILNTEPGSQPFKPSFGSTVWSYLDGGTEVEAPVIAAAIKRDLNRWEPRIEVSAVSYSVEQTVTDNGFVSGIRFLLRWNVLSDTSNEQQSAIYAVTSATNAATAGIYFILATEDGDAIVTEAGETIQI